MKTETKSTLLAVASALAVTVFLSGCALRGSVPVPFTKNHIEVGYDVKLTLKTTQDEFELPGNGKLVLLR